jgi:2-aminoadipate transaminase
VRLAEWARDVRRSALQDMLRLTSRPGVISLALGLPARELLPRAALGAAAARVLAADSTALQYEPPLRKLKQHVVDLMAQRGVSCREDEICLTAGAQQGLSLLAHLLLDFKARVLVEEVTYSGLLQAIEPFCPSLVSVSTASGVGIDLDVVEEELGRGAPPAFMYVMADGHNPLGVSLSAAKRARLVALARKHQVPVVEDDAYGFLQYQAALEPPLRALEPDWVLYVGTFSKIVAPSLRVGWLVVPRTLTGKLSAIKESLDIDTTSFAQRIVASYLDTGELASHLSVLRTEYRHRRDTMVSALREHLPPGTRWHTPSSGVFVWVELPDGCEPDLLLEEVVAAADVAFLPAAAFTVGRPRVHRNALRLNFSGSPPDQIEQGIARLGHHVRGRMERYRSHEQPGSLSR